MTPFKTKHCCQMLCLYVFALTWSFGQGQQTGETEAPDPFRNEYGISTPNGLDSYLCTKAEDDPISNDFFINLPEDTEIDSVIEHLKINGDNSQIDITVSKSDSHIAFDRDSRNLSLVSAVSREDTTTINMKLKCRIVATSQMLEMQVILMIIDVNDNPPEFSKSEYVVNVNEVTPVGTTVVRDMTATDKDVDNWYITYEIDENQMFADYFSIPIPARGEIVLEKRLDYETTQSISLRVIAKDNHLPPNDPNESEPVQLSSTATVTINVQDGDDLNPIFLNTPYMASVIESEQLNAVVNVLPPIQAVDQDTSIASNIKYSIEFGASGASDYFNINATSGQITLANSAISRGNRYTLLIKATQENNPDRYATTLVDIYVTAANENPPRFTQRLYSASVVENTPTGTVIATVSAVDNDQGTILRYSFTKPDEADGFKIDTLGGEISSTSILDFETKTQYNISVTVTDEKFFDESFLILTVIDLNDNAPEFSEPSYTFTVKREMDFVVGQVMATDRDQNPFITYRLKDDSGLFGIDGEGVIRLLSEEEKQLQFDTYTLLVSAVDGGTPSLETSVPVYINFEPKLGVVGAVASQEEDELNMVLIIVLGVICGLLLVIVVILLVYIYRNSTNQQSSPTPDFIKSQSFESRLNYERPVPNYLDDPDGMTFKPRARHLAIYNNVDSNNKDPTRNGTSQQDNPFVPDEDATLQVSRYDPGPSTDQPDYYDINDPTEKRYSSLSSMPSSFAPESNRQMRAVNEIEYETAIEPMDEQLSYGNDSSSANGSLPSSTNSVNDAFSTFRSGSSTQHLVTPRTTPKGTINKRPAVSFIDAEDVNIYNPQGMPINPNLRNMPIPIGEDDRPGITLYY